MATDREYLEMMAQNIDRRMTDGFTAIAEKIGEIKETQKTNCEDIQNLKSDSAKKTGTFSAISQIISYLWLGLITYFSVNR